MRRTERVRSITGGRQRHTRVTLRRQLTDVAARLAPDELRVLLAVATRVWAGQARYGCLDLRSDRRDFRGEALEELADAVFYLAAGMVCPRRRRVDRARGARP
jgi:hypothetical protein